jgi:hypothetical protein
MKKFTEPKELNWHMLEDDYHISADRRWAISCDYELAEDARQWVVSNWIICYSACGNADWVGIEVVPSLFEAKAAVLRLIESGGYGYDFNK